MITRSEIEASLGFAQEVTDQGISLTPIAGPLGSLVTELSVPVAISRSKETNTDDEAIKDYIPQLCNMIEHCSSNHTDKMSGSMSASSHHDEKMEDMVDLATAGVQAVLSNARTVAIPAIAAIEQAIQTKVNEMQSSSIANLVIEEVGLADVIDSEFVLDYFSDFSASHATSKLVNSNVFEPMSITDIVGLIENVDDSLTEHLSNFAMQQCGDSTVGEQVFNILFCNKRQPLYNVDSIVRAVKNTAPDGPVDALILGHFIANGLAKNIPDNTMVGVRAIETITKNVGLALGGVVGIELKAYRKLIVGKELFPRGLVNVNVATGGVNTSKPIYVNKEVFADFLSNGGTPEMIYGNIVGLRSSVSKNILANSEKCLRDYARFVGLNRTYVQNNLRAVYLDAMANGFINLLKSGEAYAEFTAESGVYERFKKCLNAFGLDDMKSAEATYVFLRGAVCHSLFHNAPEVLRIVSDMDSFAEDVEPDVAAAYITIDLITDWLAQQVDMIKHG